MRGRPKGAGAVAAEIRFERYVSPQPDGCWLWTGTKNRHGYGQFRLGADGGHKVVFAHRYSWARFTGAAVPDGLTLDHLCRMPSCVNPLHLEPVSASENSRRAGEDRRRERVTCEWGHPVFPGSRYPGTNGCRECAKERRSGLRGVPETAAHGSAGTYSNWGCRCEPCVAANKRQCAEHKRRRAELKASA